MVSPNQSRSPERKEFLFLGGHPAVDFANTLLPPPGLDVEFLRSWPDVIHWLESAGISHLKNASLPEPEVPKALETVRNLRDQWKMTLEKIMDNRGIPDSFVEQLNAVLRTHNSHEILSKDRGKNLRLHRSAPTLIGLDLVMVLLAHTIAEFLATAKFARLRRCANTDSCVLIFYDTTKNHRRQWCSNATCGNRDKVANFRRRQRISEK